MENETFKCIFCGKKLKINDIIIGSNQWAYSKKMQKTNFRYDDSTGGTFDKKKRSQNRKRNSYKIDVGRIFRMNNYETIKSMTIDEMAKMLRSRKCEYCTVIFAGENCRLFTCREKVLNIYKKWLEQEAE